ncbi:STAS domain-containing protein [Actinacidiphila alni]|uniref:STAS domain-containing protein n=1 Tax=Actinacidiphila alni TaxID=380248 RepID=UPI0034060D1E
MTINKDVPAPGTTGGIAVVDPAGELDVENLEPLRERLLQAAKSGPVVVLDASRITFGDSSFLRVLLEASHLTELRIAAPQPAIERLLSLVGMNMAMAVYPTLEEATTAEAKKR